MGRKPKSEKIRKVKREKIKDIAKAPNGMFDLFSENNLYRRKIFEKLLEFSDYYRFRHIELPILEETKIFQYSTGQSNEKKKGLYSFKTKEGEEISLRSDFTPGIVRSYLEHNLASQPKPLKFFTYGPIFKGDERKKDKLFRQFWQFNFEIIGEIDSIYDALIIQIAYGILSDLKIKNLLVEVNTIGCDQCRFDWEKELKKYITLKIKSFCNDCQKKYKDNIFKVFGCKNEACQEIKSGLPKMLDYLCPDCNNHFKSLLEYLEELEIPFMINNHLVKDFDYYTKTVFRIKETNSNKIISRGGRHDHLVEVLGGKTTSAVGFSAEIDSLVEILKKNNLIDINNLKKEPKVFLILLGELSKKKGLKVLENIRLANIPSAESFSKSSLRSQLRQAEKLNIPIVLIMGQKEALDGDMILRNVKLGSQEVIKVENIIEEIRKHLKKIK